VANRILIIDDDRDYMALLAGKLRAIGYDNLRLTAHPREAMRAFEEEPLFDLALIDMTLPELDGLAMLEHIKNHSPGTECIMITAINEARTAVDCLKKGAYDYLVKPVAKDVLALILPKALERKRLLDILDLEKRQLDPTLINPAPFAPLVTASPLMVRVLKEAELHASSNVPILITGESGTGKELLAWAIHNAGSRAKHPFTLINMAAISSTLFEAQLFGQTCLASSGGAGQRTGFLEHTHQGTLFLDEIGDLPLPLQGKLLRVLQEGEFTRADSNERVCVDLRVIAATNEDLDCMMSRQAFRKDLYYRIRGGWLHLPPLRRRPEDIPLLIETFMGKHAAYRDPLGRITPHALDLLLNYPWPGNVRELKAVIQSAVNVAQGCSLEAGHLPEHVRNPVRRSAMPTPRHPEGLRDLASVEKEHIMRIYGHFAGNKSQTARTLGIGLNTLRRKLAVYGID
jgi:DNA-binding NtrC family response regulator